MSQYGIFNDYAYRNVVLSEKLSKEWVDEIGISYQDLNDSLIEIGRRGNAHTEYVETITDKLKQNYNEEAWESVIQKISQRIREI